MSTNSIKFILTMITMLSRSGEILILSAVEAKKVMLLTTLRELNIEIEGPTFSWKFDKVRKYPDISLLPLLRQLH